MTVLNEYEVYTNGGTLIEAVAIVAVIVLFLGAVLLAASIATGELDFGIVVLIAMAVAGLFVWMVSDYITEKHTEYEVIVEDFGEIREQGFEIVEQRGEITVIKEAKQ